MKESHGVEAVFDDPNLVGATGLLPVLRLAEAAGLDRLLTAQLRGACPNAAAKASCVVAGMLTGADGIDDLDVLRHGAMTRVFTGVRARRSAPSCAALTSGTSGSSTRSTLGCWPGWPLGCRCRDRSRPAR